MSEAINKLIDDISNKNFNDAETTFNDLLNQKLKDSLDQAKIRVASQIYNQMPEVEDPEEMDDDNVSDDQELLQAADEVEQEVDAADEIELEDEEDDWDPDEESESEDEEV